MGGRARASLACSRHARPQRGPRFFSGGGEQISSQFAFARRRGLVGLRTLLDTLSDKSAPLFTAMQDVDTLNVVNRVLPVILVRKKSAPISEITHTERQMALDIVHTACVLHPKSRQYFSSHHYIEALVGFLRIDQLQVATLQALEGALVDSKPNQEVRRAPRPGRRARTRTGAGVTHPWAHEGG